MQATAAPIFLIIGRLILLELSHEGLLAVIGGRAIASFWG